MFLAAESVTSMIVQMARVVEEGIWEFDPAAGVSNILMEDEAERAAAGLTFFNTQSLGRVEID